MVTAVAPSDSSDWDATSQHSWFPDAFSIERDRENPRMPEGAKVILKSRQVRRAALEIAAFAIIMATGSLAIKAVMEENHSEPMGKRRRSAVTLNQPNVEDLSSLGTIIITVGPDANSTETSTEEAPAKVATPQRQKLLKYLTT